MRNPQRIDDILERIRTIWKENPDLRLGQLLLTVGDEDLLFYIEDDVLIRALEKIFEH